MNVETEHIDNHLQHGEANHYLTMLAFGPQFAENLLMVVDFS
jgi:hypothetical protein